MRVFFRTIFFLSVLLAAAVVPAYAIEDPAEISDIVGILKNIIALLAPSAAVALFIMLIYGGWQFLTSGGDPKSVAAARTTLTWAIIGIILVIAAWLILLLIQDITTVNVTEVKLPS